MATLFLVKYEDKYLLCNLVSSVSLLAQLTCLREFGFDLPSQQIAKAWGQCHNVSLNFETQSVCKFVSAQSNDIESPKKTIKLGNYRVNRSIVTTKEYFSWEITTDYEINIKSAADTERRTLLSRKIVLPVKTTENQAPVPLATEKKVKTVDITFLLNKLEENNLVFTIDRSDAKCHTPSRNCDVKALCDFHKSLAQWIYAIRGYFTDLFHHVRMEFDISVIQEQVQKIEIPFMPLLHKNNPLDDDGDINCQLKHQQNLQETLNEIQTNSNPIDFESQLLLVGEHIVKLQDSYFNAIEIIEQQLMAEFIALVGKNIPSGEFPKIINFHFRKILEKKFQPKSLCFPIRRANYHPEGYLYVNKFDKIEQKSRPISAFSKEICTKKAINISLNSTTKIELTGRKQIHTFLDYKFGDAHDPNLSLHIESNEFSAFIVLLGSMISATEFEPRHGIILKNKDFLKVPLFLETFPSAKQFKSFIHSLSPGQQEFAKALRNYQLESSLFAFCVIQIEPQLESILNLPPSSLHKEFLLTRDLIEVFGKYQFPPDLLAFDPLLSQNEPDSLKIQQVRSSFTQISEFIESQKQCALFESSLRSGRREAELIEEEVLPRNQGTRPFVNQELWQKGQNVDKSQFENLDILHIGPPSDFVHHVHVIFDPESGFSGMPADWTRLMKVSGISKEELCQESVLSVMEIMAFSRNVAPKAQAGEPPRPVEKKEVGIPQTPHSDQSGKSLEFISLPKMLESVLEKFDKYDAVLPTNIKIGDNWELNNKSQLFGEKNEQSVILRNDHLLDKLNEAKDILDLLTKSGLVSLEGDFHILLGYQYNYNKTLMDTIIQSNQNPIESVTSVTIEMLKAFYDTHLLSKRK